MSYVILFAFLILIGVLIGYLAGPIWSDKRPFGMWGDIAISLATTIVIGLLDWFLVPAIGFSLTTRNLAIVFEPALGALLVLWVVRKKVDR
jgi:uncharacterized membrane protein YeaQ/YmgE (transglycosylase-associated protein family)